MKFCARARSETPLKIGWLLEQIFKEGKGKITVEAKPLSDN
jgi:hypothetical protein